MMESPAEVLMRALEGRRLGGYSLLPRDLKPGRTGRETYFHLFLLRDGGISSNPVVEGLFFAGRGDYIRPWLEFRYRPDVAFSGGAHADLEGEGLTAALFSVLGELIPPGGSMMAIYGAEEHPLFRETERGLKRGFPPPATPLGRYLWNAGLRWFKDWYFPEGWLEGNMKLQATRPLDDAIRAERERGIREELRAFIAVMEGRTLETWEEDALSRAREVLSGLV